MFGFTVYSSISQADTTGKIPYPTSGEKVLGGHAVAGVGYDDKMKIKNTNPGAEETTGALLIRNSWGTGWGDGGYGWLPYEYVVNGLAVDWWSLIKNEWVDTGMFKL
jgi:C1A family cysteine protease